MLDWKRAGRGVAYAVFALLVLTAAGLAQTPTETAASRLRTGMTQREVENALFPEIHYHSHMYSWNSFRVICPQGLEMVFADGKLIRWKIVRRADGRLP
jgi:hypothetical protein